MSYKKTQTIQQEIQKAIHKLNEKFNKEIEMILKNTEQIL